MLPSQPSVQLLDTVKRSSSVEDSAQQINRVASESAKQLARSLPQNCAERLVIQFLQIVKHVNSTQGQMQGSKCQLQQKRTSQATVLKGKIDIGKLEHVLKSNNQLTESIRSNLKKAQGHLADGKIDKLQITFKVLKSNLIPLNLFEIAMLCDLNRKEAPTIKNKDLIVLVGFSGGGKTTIVSKLVGYELVQDKVDGMSTLRPNFLQPSHTKLVSGPWQRSITRTIYAEQIGAVIKKDPNELLVVDTPGFGDTQETEVDISNGLSMIQALKEAKSIRFALIVSESSWGERGVQMRKQARIVAGMLRNAKEHMGSLGFIFNKFESRALKQLPSSVEDLLRNLTAIERTQQDLMSFYSRLEYCVKPQNLIQFNPFEPATKLISKLKTLKPIRKVQQVLVESFVEQSSQKIREQLQTDLNQIRVLLSSGQFQNCVFHLENLQRAAAVFSKDFSGDITVQTLKQADQIIKAAIAEQPKKAIENIKLYLSFRSSELALQGIKESPVEVLKRLDRLKQSLGRFGYKVVEPGRILNQICREEEQMLLNNKRESNDPERLNRFYALYPKYHEQLKSRLIPEIQFLKDTIKEMLSSFKPPIDSDMLKEFQQKATQYYAQRSVLMAIKVSFDSDEVQEIVGLLMDDWMQKINLIFRPNMKEDKEDFSVSHILSVNKRIQAKEATQLFAIIKDLMKATVTISEINELFRESFNKSQLSIKDFFDSTFEFLQSLLNQAELNMPCQNNPIVKLRDELQHFEELKKQLNLEEGFLERYDEFKHVLSNSIQLKIEEYESLVSDVSFKFVLTDKFESLSKAVSAFEKFRQLATQQEIGTFDNAKVDLSKAIKGIFTDIEAKLEETFHSENDFEEREDFSHLDEAFLIVTLCSNQAFLEKELLEASQKLRESIILSCKKVLEEAIRISEEKLRKGQFITNWIAKKEMKRTLKFTHMLTETKIFSVPTIKGAYTLLKNSIETQQRQQITQSTSKFASIIKNLNDNIGKWECCVSGELVTSAREIIISLQTASNELKLFKIESLSCETSCWLRPMQDQLQAYEGRLRSYIAQGNKVTELTNLFKDLECFQGICQSVPNAFQIDCTRIKDELLKLKADNEEGIKVKLECILNVGNSDLNLGELSEFWHSVASLQEDSSIKHYCKDKLTAFLHSRLTNIESEQLLASQITLKGFLRNINSIQARLIEIKTISHNFLGNNEAKTEQSLKKYRTKVKEGLIRQILALCEAMQSSINACQVSKEEIDDFYQILGKFENTFISQSSLWTELSPEIRTFSKEPLEGITSFVAWLQLLQQKAFNLRFQRYTNFSLIDEKLEKFSMNINNQAKIQLKYKIETSFRTCLTKEMQQWPNESQLRQKLMLKIKMVPQYLDVGLVSIMNRELELLAQRNLKIIDRVQNLTAEKAIAEYLAIPVQRQSSVLTRKLKEKVQQNFNGLQKIKYDFRMPEQLPELLSLIQKMISPISKAVMAVSNKKGAIFEEFMRCFDQTSEKPFTLISKAISTRLTEYNTKWEEKIAKSEQFKNYFRQICSALTVLAQNTVLSRVEYQHRNLCSQIAHLFLNDNASMNRELEELTRYKLGNLAHPQQTYDFSERLLGLQNFQKTIEEFLHLVLGGCLNSDSIYATRYQMVKSKKAVSEQRKSLDAWAQRWACELSDIKLQQSDQRTDELCLNPESVKKISQAIRSVVIFTDVASKASKLGVKVDLSVELSRIQFIVREAFKDAQNSLIKSLKHEKPFVCEKYRKAISFAMQLLNVKQGKLSLLAEQMATFEAAYVGELFENIHKLVEARDYDASAYQKALKVLQKLTEFNNRYQKIFQQANKLRKGTTKINSEPTGITRNKQNQSFEEPKAERWTLNNIAADNYKRIQAAFSNVVVQQLKQYFDREKVNLKFAKQAVIGAIDQGNDKYLRQLRQNYLSICNKLSSEIKTQAHQKESLKIGKYSLLTALFGLFMAQGFSFTNFEIQMVVYLTLAENGDQNKMHCHLMESPIRSHKTLLIAGCMHALVGNTVYFACQSKAQATFLKSKVKSVQQALRLDTRLQFATLQEHLRNLLVFGGQPSFSGNVMEVLDPSQITGWLSIIKIPFSGIMSYFSKSQQQERGCYFKYSVLIFTQVRSLFRQENNLIDTQLTVNFDGRHVQEAIMLIKSKKANQKILQSLSKSISSNRDLQTILLKELCIIRDAFKGFNKPAFSQSSQTAKSKMTDREQLIQKIIHSDLNRRWDLKLKAAKFNTIDLISEFQTVIGVSCESLSKETIFFDPFQKAKARKYLNLGFLRESIKIPLLPPKSFPIDKFVDSIIAQLKNVQEDTLAFFIIHDKYLYNILRAKRNKFTMLAYFLEQFTQATLGKYQRAFVIESGLSSIRKMQQVLSVTQKNQIQIFFTQTANFSFDLNYLLSKLSFNESVTIQMIPLQLIIQQQQLKQPQISELVYEKSFMEAKYLFNKKGMPQNRHSVQTYIDLKLEKQSIIRLMHELYEPPSSNELLLVIEVSSLTQQFIQILPDFLTAPGTSRLAACCNFIFVGCPYSKVPLGQLGYTIDPPQEKIFCLSAHPSVNNGVYPWTHFDASKTCISFNDESTIMDAFRLSTHVGFIVSTKGLVSLSRQANLIRFMSSVSRGVFSVGVVNKGPIQNSERMQYQVIECGLDGIKDFHNRLVEKKSNKN